MDVIGNFINLLSNAMTSSWALGIAIIGIFIGVASWLMGDHGGKGVMGKVAIGSVILLSLNQFIGWLRG